jgi:UDP-glucose 4-epimerase
LVIFGDGEQTRDFVYIDDVIEALMAAATAEGVNRKVINVGLGQETSLNELVRAIERVIGCEAHVLHVRAESGGVSRLVADLSSARRWLAYEPKVELERGLRFLLGRDPQFDLTANRTPFD